MNKLTIEETENKGYIVYESGDYASDCVRRKWVFETVMALCVFIKEWGEGKNR